MLPALVNIFVTQTNSRARWKYGEAYLNPNPIRGVLFPRSMDNLDLHQASHILVELTHQKVHIKQEIELPAFSDHGIPKDIFQPNCIDIVA
jgi:hypothetical protein